MGICRLGGLYCPGSACAGQGAMRELDAERIASLDDKVLREA
jgi:hypothetical protein